MQIFLIRNNLSLRHVKKVLCKDYTFHCKMEFQIDGLLKIYIYICIPIELNLNLIRILR